jgi:hypothetical protein
MNAKSESRGEFEVVNGDGTEASASYIHGHLIFVILRA